MPDGVVNVIHGQHDCVNFICDHPDIKAISFVGESIIGVEVFHPYSLSLQSYLEIETFSWPFCNERRWLFSVVLKFPKFSERVPFPFL